MDNEKKESNLENENNIENLEEKEKLERLKKNNAISNKIMLIGGIIVIILCLMLLCKNIFFKSDTKDDNIKNNTNISLTSATAPVTTTTSSVDKDKITVTYAMDRLLDKGYALTKHNITNKKIVSTYKKDKYEATLTQTTLSSYKAPFNTSDAKYLSGTFKNGEGQDYSIYLYKKDYYVIWQTPYYAFEIKGKNLTSSTASTLVFFVEAKGE